jgi:hypothetical protein
MKQPAKDGEAPLHLASTDGARAPASPLADLRDRLRDYKVQVDPRVIATIFLGIAHAGDWMKNQQEMMVWIGQLALLDVVNEQ